MGQARERPTRRRFVLALPTPFVDGWRGQVLVDGGNPAMHSTDDVIATLASDVRSAVAAASGRLRFTVLQIERQPGPRPAR